MELRHLRYFRAVAEEGHFAKAAVKLCIEPSPLSKTIKDLENEIGLRLLERDSRQTKLTDAGKFFLQRVNTIFGVLEEINSYC
ncbi:MAG: LysR family transcriptional regulator, partial [Saezia sp.]